MKKARPVYLLSFAWWDFDSVLCRAVFVQKWRRFGTVIVIPFVLVKACVKWGLAQSPSCDCGQHQTMNHTCSLTKFEGGLNLLHNADDDAVIWLESTATAALAK